MRIGILGSRGIPNNYGGFEQLAEYLADGLTNLDAEVWVYNSHNHPFKHRKWRDVNLIHCYDPEFLMGQAGQYIYDFNCIRDSRSRNFDILLQLGYTSSSIWHRLLPQKSVIVTNMDGLEWKRSKYSRPVRKYLKYAEKLAVKSSHRLVADSEAIQEYLTTEYGVAPTFIPYGADIFNNPDEKAITKFDVEAGNYYLLIARLQPDNHIEEIIKGVLASNSGKPLVIIGNHYTSYGNYLLKKFNGPLIRFQGAEFDKILLDNLRFFASLYFHGHSAGGTNPSLLEAMAASARICAHNNVFNRSVIAQNAIYFDNADQITALIKNSTSSSDWPSFIQNNLKKIKTIYNWENVILSYNQLFLSLLKNKSEFSTNA